jgi:hypothetical protein
MRSLFNYRPSIRRADRIAFAVLAALVIVAYVASANGCFRWPVVIVKGGHGGGDAQNVK